MATVKTMMVSSWSDTVQHGNTKQIHNSFPCSLREQKPNKQKTNKVSYSQEMKRRYGQLAIVADKLSSPQLEIWKSKRNLHSRIQIRTGMQTNPVLKCNNILRSVLPRYADSKDSQAICAAKRLPKRYIFPWPSHSKVYIRKQNHFKKGKKTTIFIHKLTFLSNYMQTSTISSRDDTLIRRL